MKVVLIKLVTGELITGRISEKTDEALVLDKPMGVVASLDPRTGRIGASFVPYLPMVKGEGFQFPTKYVMNLWTEDLLDRSFVDAYLRVTSEVVLAREVSSEGTEDGSNGRLAR